MPPFDVWWILWLPVSLYALIWSFDARPSGMTRDLRALLSVSASVVMRNSTRCGMPSSSFPPMSTSSAAVLLSTCCSCARAVSRSCGEGTRLCHSTDHDNAQAHVLQYHRHGTTAAPTLVMRAMTRHAASCWYNAWLSSWRTVFKCSRSV